MKRILLLITAFASIIFIIFLFCNGNADKQNFHGTYTFDELVYLTGLSSSTVDYANKTRADTKYTIEAELFKIESNYINIEVSNPDYVNEDVQFDSFLLLFNEHIIQDYGFKYQYDIKDKDGNKINWKLYISPEHLFIASYHNSPNGSEIIWEIAKLSK